jgi:hypothetical protein
MFRDSFELNQEEANEIRSCMEKGGVCTRFQKKYFRVKRHIQDHLNESMDLQGTGEKFEVLFPDKCDSYGWCHLYNGGTGSGKTHALKMKIETNLNRAKKHRRKFLYFSPEWDCDDTLKSLRADKYREYITGIDVSDRSYKEGEYASPEQFFQQEIQARVDRAQPGTCICFDDSCDFAEGTQDMVRRLITKLLRVGRHSRLGICYCLHRLRHGQWSQQATSSCQHIICFMRSNKHKIRDYLNKEFGVPMTKCRELVHKFSQAGRASYIRLHTPQMLITDQLITLL